MKIGFIGLGHMGNPMARNLLKHGHTLKVFDVMPELVKQLAELGCEHATSAQKCAEEVDVVITMLPSSPHVRSVYLSATGVLSGATAGTLLIDSSTIDPHTARDVAFDAKAKGFNMIDAPVSGGTGGAESGTLTFMVGGDIQDFEKAKAILECMGKNIVHCGGAGNGQVAKICNNMMLAIEMIATAEGMSLAAKLGMTPKYLQALPTPQVGAAGVPTPTIPTPAFWRTHPLHVVTPAGSARI